MKGHPVDIIAQDIAQGTKILCLDELHVSDVADALILGQVTVPQSHHLLLGCLLPCIDLQPQLKLVVHRSCSLHCCDKAPLCCSHPIRCHQNFTKMA